LTILFHTAVTERTNELRLPAHANSMTSQKRLTQIYLRNELGSLKKVY